MKRLIEFPLEDGDLILVEVDVDEEVGGLVSTASDGRNDVPVKATMTFEAAMEKVKPAAVAIVKKLKALSDPPDEMEVSFGLKLSADAGAVVASAGIEANYTVTLKWKRVAEKASTNSI